MRMDEFNAWMRARGKEIIGKKIAEMNAETAIRETAWAKIRRYRRCAIVLFCLGIIYILASLLLKQPADIFLFVLIYGFSLFSFIGSLVTRHRLSRGYYGTTDSEVREVIAHLLSKQKR